jgi:hypothetical protein
MAEGLIYHVMPDPDGGGWVVAAEGFVPRSLPYDSKEQAIEVAELLARSHPGAAVVVDARPPALTPIEVEHRIAA